MWINSNLFIVASLRSFRCARFEMLRFVRKVFSYSYLFNIRWNYIYSISFHPSLTRASISLKLKVLISHIKIHINSYRVASSRDSISSTSSAVLTENGENEQEKEERKIWISFHVWTVQIINMTQQQLHESPYIYFNFSSLICPLSIFDRMISSQGWESSRRREEESRLRASELSL